MTRTPLNRPPREVRYTRNMRTLFFFWLRSEYINMASSRFGTDSKLQLLLPDTWSGGFSSSSFILFFKFLSFFSPEMHDVVVLSLRTLGSFRMDGIYLLPFVKDCAASYLTCPSKIIRREAALTCCRLLIEPGKPVRFRGPSARVIEEVLQKLLQVMVSDPDSTIRHLLVR